VKYFLFLMLFFLASCTFAVNQVHTEGSASDVVDEDQTADASLELPLTKLL